MLGQLTRLFFPTASQQRAHVLYVALVGQSRNPFFYRELAVPDTLDGRFEMILLHMFATLYRLKAPQERAVQGERPEFERLLIETYFADMDRSLREIGVGDLGVGRRVKTMANAFYGRMQAYEAALAGEESLPEALRRNLYGTASGSEVDPAPMARYLHTAIETLKAQPAEAIRNGTIRFPDPAAAVQAESGR